MTAKEYRILENPKGAFWIQSRENQFFGKSKWRMCVGHYDRSLDYFVPYKFLDLESAQKGLLEKIERDSFTPITHSQTRVLR